MRFLHTADWHLGKRLHGFSLLDDQREVLDQIVDIVASAAPDAVVVAGDVFDTQVPHVGALALWEMAVDAIVGEHGVPMVVIPGNHDHAGRLAVHAGLARRAGLHFLRSLAECDEPVTVAGVDFFGVPFHKPVHVNSLLRHDAPRIGDFDYAAAMNWAVARVKAGRAATRTDPARRAVLVAHAFVAGAGEESEGEDAISVGGAGAVPTAALAGFDYVALGHIHRPLGLGAESGGSIVYSGSPYPYSFAEAGGVKSVALVDLSGSEAVVERVPIETSRSLRVISGMSFAEVLAAAATESTAQMRHYTLVQVTDTDPLTDARASLREWYPNSVLEQPLIEAPHWVPRLEGDYRTTTPADAFERFHRHVFGEELSDLERELLAEAAAATEADDEPTVDSGAIEP